MPSLPFLLIAMNAELYQVLLESVDERYHESLCHELMSALMLRDFPPLHPTSDQLYDIQERLLQVPFAGDDAQRAHMASHERFIAETGIDLAPGRALTDDAHPEGFSRELLKAAGIISLAWQVITYGDDVIDSVEEFKGRYPRSA